MVVRLSALLTGRLNHHEILLELVSVGVRFEPKTIERSEGICFIKKNSYGTICDRTSNLPIYRKAS
jgi:tRNA U34 2-thiouridine synthase MnmA/TrmU